MRWCYYYYLQDLPGRSLGSRCPPQQSKRNQSPSPIHNVRSLPPRFQPPPRQDPPTRGIPTASASSPRSTRPPSWNNLHRHTASDPSPSPRGGWGGTATRRRNPTALIRVTDNAPLSLLYRTTQYQIVKRDCNVTLPSCTYTQPHVMKILIRCFPIQPDVMNQMKRFVRRWLKLVNGRLVVY